MPNTQMPLDEQLQLLVEKNRELIKALRNLRKRLGAEGPVEKKEVFKVSPPESKNQTGEEK